MQLQELCTFVYCNLYSKPAKLNNKMYIKIFNISIKILIVLQFISFLSIKNYILKYIIFSVMTSNIFFI